MAQQKKRIVVVDDDEDLTNLLSAAFKGKGFDVSVFNNGKEGEAFLLGEKNLDDVALIILDRILPDMDGLEILKKFEEKFPKKVPVLILSVLSSEKDILSGLRKGAVDYVAKPFSLPILMEKANSLMGK